MRSLAILLSALALAAFQTPSLDSVVQFLITSAATDFHTHPPTDPAKLRNVRLGHVTTPSGERNYRLCGEFLPKQDGAKAQWTRFATLQTSGYEQWIGEQSTRYCHGATFSWDKTGDLSSRLQQRLDSLRLAP